MRGDIWPDWRGRRAVVVASGPSACAEDAALLARARGLDDIRVIAVNRAGLDLCPWADALYACDHDFWNNYPAARDFAGLKMTQSAVACEWWPDLRKVAVDTDAALPLFDLPGRIWSGGNGGSQALNLVAQWGSEDIALVGFDMTVENGRHFHPDHPTRSQQPGKADCERWREALGRAAPQLLAKGVRVTNCSRKTALTCFARMSIDEWLVEEGATCS